MNRPQSRWQIRKSATRAFLLRNRLSGACSALRSPDAGETPLSLAEVLHGVRHGLISDHPAHARATEGARP